MSSVARTPPSYTTMRPSGRSGRDGTQFTARIRPTGRSSPSSSATSRRQAACGDSSASTAPPGKSQVSRYTGSTRRTRPDGSRHKAPAAIRLRASDATYTSGGMTPGFPGSIHGTLAGWCSVCELRAESVRAEGFPCRHTQEFSLPQSDARAYRDRLTRLPSANGLLGCCLGASRPTSSSGVRPARPGRIPRPLWVRPGYCLPAHRRWQGLRLQGHPRRRLPAGHREAHGSA